jgi:hypothetical protein
MTNLTDALKACTVQGNVIKLPSEQLDRKIYMDVKKAFEGIGGKWKGDKVYGFEFDSDPSDLLTELQGGEKRNLKKEAQAFFTPHPLALKCVKHLGIEKNDTILEPSAGDGAMIKAIHEFAPDYSKAIDCCELMDNHVKKLEAITYPKDNPRAGTTATRIVGTDFMTFDPKGFKYNKIIANPPFTKDQDIAHVQRMHGMLKNTGTMVTIMGTGWMFKSTSKSANFRKWLDNTGCITTEDWSLLSRLGGTRVFTRENGDSVYVEIIPAGAFKESGTNIQTCMVVIDRVG